MPGMTDTPLTDIALTTLDGQPTTLGQLADGAVLVVNVASKCGLTPQYTALERLAKDYRDRGLTVVGVPCNQFMGQEPGSAEEIAEFCSTTYGVTFPLLEKTDVNGEGRHPLYAELTKTADDAGEAGAHRPLVVEQKAIEVAIDQRMLAGLPAADHARRIVGHRRR